MSVVVSMEEVGPCRTRLTVEVPPAALEAETRRVVEDYREAAQGFDAYRTASYIRQE